MSRVVLVMMFAVAAMACRSKSDPPAVTPAAVAGKVLEVSGNVTVGARALAVGDGIAEGDVIDTGSDGRIVVELTHNLARWELGPNKHVRPTESIAWKLPRDERNAQVVIQDMSAAGRPAERAAAETSATSGGGAAPHPAPPGPIAASNQAGPGGPGPVPPPNSTAKQDAAPARRNRAAPKGLAAKTGYGAGSVDELFGDSPRPTGAARSADDPTEHDQAAFVASRAAVAACLDADLPWVVVAVHVSAANALTVDVTGQGPVGDAVKHCITEVVGKLKLVGPFDAKLTVKK